MRRLVLFTFLALSCRDPATLLGTALLVTVDSSDVEIDQLRYGVELVDGGVVLEPTLRPANAGGTLAPTTTVRVLLKDSLAGQALAVKVEGLAGGAVVGAGQSEVLVVRGREAPVVIKLLQPQPGCQGCVGPAGDCVTTPTAQACGKNGAACVSCDPVMANACSSAGACACGARAPCSAALGADRCENGECRCGTAPACAAGQECVAQTCQCTPTSCPGGCCQANTCVTAPSSSACGTGGRACLDCGGSACNGGLCAMSACNPTTCPTGCCLGAACITSQTNVACGTGAVACESCGAGTCDAGACVGGCSPATCPGGCCAGGACQPGTAPGACGTGGVACLSCPGACVGQKCEGGCGPATCPLGCCQGGACQPGTLDSACGRGGEACSACMGGSSCGFADGGTPDGSVCVVTSSCNASNCPTGCCDGVTCQPSSKATCGSAGSTCRACASTADGCLPTGQCGCGSGPACGPGQRCDGGLCECDPATCAGCCDGATCRSGTSRTKCGTDGGACSACGSLQCRMGVCQ